MVDPEIPNLSHSHDLSHKRIALSLVLVSLFSFYFSFASLLSPFGDSVFASLVCTSRAKSR
jgi:hypothetical protein